MHRLFIVCGSPASGKSTHARKLAAEHHAVLLDIDTVTERLIRLSLLESGHDPDDRDSKSFKRTYRDPIYETLFDIAADNLAHAPVVIAGPFTLELRDENWPAKLERRFLVRPEIHYVHCPPAERKLRIQARKNPRDIGKLADWDTFLRYYGAEGPPCFPAIHVNTAPQT